MWKFFFPPFAVPAVVFLEVGNFSSHEFFLAASSYRTFDLRNFVTQPALVFRKWVRRFVRPFFLPPLSQGVGVLCSRPFGDPGTFLEVVQGTFCGVKRWSFRNSPVAFRFFSLCLHLPLLKTAKKETFYEL